MCGFGSLSVLPFQISPLAQAQFTFSKKATSLQGTSIRTYYNQRKSDLLQDQFHSPQTQTSSNTNITSTPLSNHYSTIIDTMASWLHRRGPNATNIVHFDTADDTISEPSQSQMDLTSSSNTSHQLSLVASVLHLRGIEGEPIAQPMFQTSTLPASIQHHYPLPSFSDAYNSHETTFQERFQHNQPPKATIYNFNINSTSTSSSQPLPYTSSSIISTNPFNNDTDQLFFCWNGEIFAGDIQVEVGESDTVLLFQSLLSSISTTLLTSPRDSTVPSQSINTQRIWLNCDEYSQVIASSIHAVLNRVQGPYATMIVHTSTPLQISQPDGSVIEQKVTTVVICRDKVGRRSLLLRLFQPQSDPLNSNKSPPDTTNISNGFVVSSQAFQIPFSTSASEHSSLTSNVSNINTTTPFSDPMPSNRSGFTFHSPDWFEIPCSGLFFLSYPSLTPQPHSISTLSFLPWNHLELSSYFFQHPNQTKTPESFLFPTLHPSLTPLPNPLLLLPPKLQEYFISIAHLTKTPLPSQLFFLRLAEAVRRQVQQLPKVLVSNQFSNSNVDSTTISSLAQTPLNFSTDASQITVHPARIAILFSGGIDCTIVAALTHFFLPLDEPIDLINVAFTGTKSPQIIDTTAPDRIASMDSLLQLINLAPERHWRLIKVNITKNDLLEHTSIISSLIAPHNTTMDCNIGSVLYFGARGQGVIHVPTLQQVTDITNETPPTKIVSNPTSNVPSLSNDFVHNPAPTVRYAEFCTITPSSSSTISFTSTPNSLEAQKYRLQAQKEKEKQYENIPITKELFNRFPQRTSGMQFTSKTVATALPKPITVKMKKLLGEEAKLTIAISRTKERFGVMTLGDEIALTSERQLQLTDEMNVLNTFLNDNLEALYVSHVLCNGLSINPEDCPNEQSNSNSSLKISASNESTTSCFSIKETWYTSTARVLLLGSGADEQLGGYGRHRTGYKNALRHLMRLSLNKQDIIDIQAREEELYGSSASRNQSKLESTLHDSSQNIKQPKSRKKVDKVDKDISVDESTQDVKDIPTPIGGGDDDEDDIGAGWLELIDIENCNIIEALHKYQTTSRDNLTTTLNTITSTSLIESLQTISSSKPTPLHNLSTLQKHQLQEYALHIDLKKDTLRIWLRNLGRDDRVLAYWGKESRIPFLDEDVMNFLTCFRVEDKCNVFTNFQKQNESNDTPLSQFDLVCDEMKLYYALENQLAQLYENTMMINDPTSSSQKQQLIYSPARMTSYLTSWNDLINSTLIDGQNGNKRTSTSTSNDRVSTFPLTTLCNMLLPQGIGDKLLLRLCTSALSIKKTSVLQKRAMQFGSKIANRHVTGVVRLNQVNSVLDIVNPQLMD